MNRNSWIPAPAVVDALAALASVSTRSAKPA